MLILKVTRNVCLDFREGTIADCSRQLMHAVMNWNWVVIHKRTNESSMKCTMPIEVVILGS